MDDLYKLYKRPEIKNREYQLNVLKKDAGINDYWLDNTSDVNVKCVYAAYSSLFRDYSEITETLKSRAISNAKDHIKIMKEVEKEFGK